MVRALQAAGARTILPDMRGFRAAQCDGDHHSSPYDPTFQQAAVQFFKEQWRVRRAN
jgi:hypothetical protein